VSLSSRRWNVKSQFVQSVPTRQAPKGGKSGEYRTEEVLKKIGHAKTIVMQNYGVFTTGESDR
jgi:hypothetical protein